MLLEGRLEDEALKLIDSIPERIKAMCRGAETALYWKETGEVVQGSISGQRMCVLDMDSLLISDSAFDFPEQAAAELFAAFHRLPGSKALQEVESAMKALLKLAFGPEGPEGIPALLQKLKIKTRLEIRDSLHPGDTFPEEMLHKLVDSVNMVFEARPSTCWIDGPVMSSDWPVFPMSLCC